MKLFHQLTGVGCLWCRDSGADDGWWGRLRCPAVLLLVGGKASLWFLDFVQDLQYKLIILSCSLQTMFF